MPVANFTVSSTNGIAPFTVKFTDQSSNLPTSWLWDFGDGTTSTAQNPTHTYSNTGTYTVTLTAINMAGNNTTTKTGYIVAPTRGPDPIWTAKSEWSTDLNTGSFFATPCLVDLDNDGDLDLLLGLYNRSTLAYENTGNNTNPVWTRKSAWDPPSLSSGNPASPTVADLDGDGDYDLLIGCLSGGNALAYQNTGNNTAPVWTRKSAWDLPSQGKPCLADLDGDGDFDLLVANRYDEIYGFENTAPSVGSTPDLVPISINLPSSITVESNCTVSAVITNNGTVNVGAFIATLTVDGVLVDTQNVQGPNAGENSTVNFNWTPTTLGDHTLTVTVDSVDGIDESDETNNIMTVVATLIPPAPVADFSADVTSGDPQLTVHFTDQSSNSPTEWLWDFGDGTRSTEQNPTHTYNSSDKYTVTLKKKQITSQFTL